MVDEKLKPMDFLVCKALMDYPTQNDKLFALILLAPSLSHPIHFR